MEGKIPPPREKNRLTEIFSEIGSQTVPPPPVPHLEMVIFGQFPTQTRRSEENMSLRVHTPKIRVPYLLVVPQLGLMDLVTPRKEREERERVEQLRLSAHSRDTRTIPPSNPRRTQVYSLRT